MMLGLRHTQPFLHFKSMDEAKYRIERDALNVCNRWLRTFKACFVARKSMVYYDESIKFAEGLIVTLGEKIYQLRKASRLSQEQFAEQLGVSRQSVSKWELNESKPEIDNIVAISKIFSVSIDDLLKEEGSGGYSDKNNSIERVASLNMLSKRIQSGVSVLILGCVMLVLEFVFLPIYAMIHKSVVNGQGFYSDPIKYASMPPMPIVFAVTGIVIIIGLYLTLSGYSRKHRL